MKKENNRKESVYKVPPRQYLITSVFSSCYLDRLKCAQTEMAMLAGGYRIRPLHHCRGVKLPQQVS